jgi:hypothetical protein
MAKDGMVLYLFQIQATAIFHLHVRLHQRLKQLQCERLPVKILKEAKMSMVHTAID